MKKYILVLLPLISCPSWAEVPKSFINIVKVNPKIQVELRYATEWNFVGHKISGYNANKCYLAKESADALGKAQSLLEGSGYSILVFDCYRPKRAVQEFMDWTKNSADQKMKTVFYQSEKKEILIERGYISNRSGHSRGSTVDLTLVKTNIDRENPYRAPGLLHREEFKDCRAQENIETTGQLDMGTTFDCFSEMSYTQDSTISKQASSNRKKLLQVMEQVGFKNYSKEWWHFTLSDEPFPKTYFDFVIE